MKLKIFQMPVFHGDMQKVTFQTVLHDMIHHSEKKKKGKKQVLYASLGILRSVIVEILLCPLLKIIIAGRILIKDWQQFS